MKNTKILHVTVLCLAAVLLFPENAMAEKQKRRLFEVSLLGSYLVSSGTPEAESVAPDLYTGRWSPWFGQGYDDFNWTGSHPPTPLDNVIGAPAMRHESGPAAGFRLGFNIHPHWQIEFTFSYAFCGLRFEDEAWEAVDSALLDSVNLLRAYGAMTRATDRSIQSAGKTRIYGLNLHFNILDEGPFIPSIFAGILVVRNIFSAMPGEDKFIEYFLGQQDPVRKTEARYFLDVYYTESSRFGLDFGAGAKIFLSRKSGIKLEVGAIYSPLVLDQKVMTCYDEDYWWWLDFDNYDRIAVTQRTERIMFTAGIGYFLTF